tara:strand:- start:318 stop:566 length:249 start_codon:yes stop_codon:yes gene_type:complete
MTDDYLKKYADRFNYKQLVYPIDFKKETYVKKTHDSFIVLEALKESKYVNFYFNDKSKTFKKSDLLISILENTPVGWEEEND